MTKLVENKDIEQPSDPKKPWRIQEFDKTNASWHDVEWLNGEVEIFYYAESMKKTWPLSRYRVYNVIDGKNAAEEILLTVKQYLEARAKEYANKIEERGNQQGAEIVLKTFQMILLVVEEGEVISEWD